MFFLASGDGDEGHGVVAEDVDHLDGDGVAAGFGVGMAYRRQFQVAALARAESLPFVLENVCARPAFLEVLRLQRRPTARSGGSRCPASNAAVSNCR